MCGMLYLYFFVYFVVYYDLKLVNLLVDVNWILKVSDFGMSELKSYTYGLNCKVFGGMFEWMVFEVFCGDDVNEFFDVFLFGVILWEFIILNFSWVDFSLFV